MIHGEPALRLPLVYHLVQQGPSDFIPAVAVHVPSPDPDQATGGRHLNVAEPTSHPVRHPEGGDRQRPAEVPPIERRVQLPQSRQDVLIPFPQHRLRGTGRGWRNVVVDPERHQLPARRPADRPAPFPRERHDGAEHRVWRVGEPPVEPDGFPSRVDQHPSILVDDEPDRGRQPRLRQSSCQEDPVRLPRLLSSTARSLHWAPSGPRRVAGRTGADPTGGRRAARRPSGTAPREPRPPR